MNACIDFGGVRSSVEQKVKHMNTLCDGPRFRIEALKFATQAARVALLRFLMRFPISA